MFVVGYTQNAVIDDQEIKTPLHKFNQKYFHGESDDTTPNSLLWGEYLSNDKNLFPQHSESIVP